MMNATIQMPAVVPQAEALVNDAPRTFTEADFPIGTVAHQGDLVMVRIRRLPKSAKKRSTRQMADGSTQGSRHILTEMSGDAFDCDAEEVVKALKTACPKVDIGAQYIGPVFRTPAALEHPEHGDHIYAFEGVVAVVVQRNLDAERREQRTRD